MVFPTRDVPPSDKAAPGSVVNPKDIPQPTTPQEWVGDLQFYLKGCLNFNTADGGTSFFNAMNHACVFANYIEAPNPNYKPNMTQNFNNYVSYLVNIPLTLPGSGGTTTMAQLYQEEGPPLNQGFSALQPIIQQIIGNSGNIAQIKDTANFIYSCPSSYNYLNEQAVDDPQVYPTPYDYKSLFTNLEGTIVRMSKDGEGAFDTDFEKFRNEIDQFLSITPLWGNCGIASQSSVVNNVTSMITELYTTEDINIMTCSLSDAYYVQQYSADWANNTQETAAAIHHYLHP